MPVDRTLPDPVIVVPGITATYLRDEYALPPETVWSVLTKHYDRFSLHPDDMRYESAEPARVRPDQVFEVAYRELIQELRHNLSARDDQPVPVYPFAYDWRRPLKETEADLARFIDEVIGRTSLLRHYDKAGYAEAPRVNLVGHSMGGLIIAGCLQTLGAGARVGKVATLATPFRGSFEAVLRVAAGTANLGAGDASSREREAARVTPSLYHLVPQFEGALQIEGDGLPVSLFEPGLWQPSVVATIAEYVRRFGRDATGRTAQAAAIFAAMLRDAKEHRERVEAFRLDAAGLTDKDWLCVVGVNSKTRVSLRIEVEGSKPRFVLDSDDRENHWQDGADAAARSRTGDGTVPFLGAQPAFLAPENLVCVCPDDFGYWEVGDRVLAAAAGFHGILPNMDLVHRMLVRHFTGRPDRHGNTWGRPAPGVTSPVWPLEMRVET